MCETGGSIEARAGNDKGFQSQSMKAIYYLSQAGVRVKASVVEGGLSRWAQGREAGGTTTCRAWCMRRRCCLPQ